MLLNLPVLEALHGVFGGFQEIRGIDIFSAQAQAPVVPVFIHRTPDGNHAIQTLPAIEPPPDREPETIRKATQEYNLIIENQVRQHPEQWIWLHRRWKTRPLP